MRKYIAILIISALILSSIADASAYQDVKEGKIYIDSTSSYAWYINANFYDSEGKEIQELRIKDHGSSNTKFDLNPNAKSMSIDIGAWVCGDREAHFKNIVAQACSFDMRGPLGSTARVEYKFADGKSGIYNFY